MKQPFIIIMLACLPAFIFSQPRLTKLTPDKMYTQNESQAQGYGTIDLNLELTGENFLKEGITGFNFSDRVKLFFVKGDKREQIKIYSYNSISLTTLVRSDAWLNNSTPVQIYVEVDGVQSNSLYLNVVDIPRVPPTITSLRPDHVTVGKDETMFFVYGKNLGETRTTRVKVNGIEAQIGNSSYIDGWVYVYLPKSLRETPGTYTVTVESIFGNSNPNYFTVDKAVMKLAPAQIVKVNPNARPIEIQKTQSMGKLDIPVNFLPKVNVQMTGSVKSESLKTQLYEYIKDLPDVKSISNNLKTADAGTVSVSIGGTKEKAVLESVKYSIEKKLQVMGIAGTVIIQ